MSYPNLNNRKFFSDLDGVGANFAKARDAMGISSLEFKLLPGVYRNLEPYPGYVEFIRELVDIGWDVWIATKIPNDNPGAATEKLLWVAEHLPFLRKSVIITPNKGTLGGPMDFLWDDRPHKAHCEDFVGTLLRYSHENEYKTIAQVREKMLKHNPDGRIIKEIQHRGEFIPVRFSNNQHVSVVSFEDMQADVAFEFGQYLAAQKRISWNEAGHHVTEALNFNRFISQGMVV